MTGVLYDFGAGIQPYKDDILKTASNYISVDWPNTFHGLRADIVADLNHSLPIDSSVADTIVCFQVMEHLCEPQTMLNEAIRILKPGGKIILSVPFQWWIHEEPYDYFRFTRYGLQYMLTKAGFIEIEVEEVAGFWSMWFLKLNYQTNRLVRGPWILQLIVRSCLLPFWFINQLASPIVDRFWHCFQETQGYFVKAKKYEP